MRRRAITGAALGLVLLAGLAAVLAGPAPQPADRALPSATLPADRPALRILAFGTSLTARATWPDALGPRLAACLGRPVEVRRLARPGAGSDWALTQERALSAAAPDIVIVEFAINDADLLDGVSARRQARQHRALLEEIARAAPDAGVLLMTTNPVAGWQRLKRPFLAARYRLYRRLAAEAGTGLADLWPRWGGQGPGGDGLHPDPAAEAAIALPVLTAMVGARFGRDCPAS